MILKWNFPVSAFLLVGVLCSWLSESFCSLAWPPRHKVHSKTGTAFICIGSVLPCCKNFHCACFKIELVFCIVYCRFPKTSHKEDEFVWLCSYFWAQFLKEMNLWRLLFLCHFDPFSPDYLHGKHIEQVEVCLVYNACKGTRGLTELEPLGAVPLARLWSSFFGLSSLSLSSKCLA